jgi:PAS domain S-box-containing protein
VVTDGDRSDAMAAQSVDGIAVASLEAELLAANPKSEPNTFWVLTDAMPHMVWSTRPDGFHDYYNARWYEFTGVPDGSTDGEAWAGMFHDEDQPRAWKNWRHSLATGEPYEVEYRLRHRSGEYRWMLGRAMPIRDDTGSVVRWIGTCTDIHEAKVIASQNELLSRELAHRIKNIFAVIGGLIGLSARERPEARDYARELRERISALGRAHEFVRPHSEESQPRVEFAALQSLLEELLSPYPALKDGRLVIAGANPLVDDRSATPLALAFHELATNSAKYGALAAPDGRVSLDISEDSGRVTINWQEFGGPPVSSPPQRTSFGTRLVDLAIGTQMQGEIAREWSSDGLKVRIAFPTRNLTR